MESVLVDKAVAVEGDGDREAIVVEGPDLPAFVLSAARASICRVTVIGGPADIDALAPEEDYWRFAAVVVTADVLVTDIVIRNGWTDGISVSHSSSPTISDNDIRKRDGIGIAVFDSSSPAITGNDIRESNFGICAMDNSTPRVEGNTIRENDDEGVSVAGSAARDRWQRHPREQVGWHLGIRRRSSGDREQRYRRERPPRPLGDRPFPLIAGNRVNRNLGPGISISGKTSAPTITGNSISANGNSGIEVSQGAKPTIEGNEFSDNGGSGIWAWGDGTSPATLRQSLP